MIFRIGYDIALHVYALSSIPKMLWDYWIHKKYRKNFWQKLGKRLPALDRDPNKPLVWIHAVSLGETKGVALLLEKLRSEASILLSTTTETGYEEGKKWTQPHEHLYLPFDFPYVIGPVIRKLKPDVVILMETDFWFNFQNIAQQNGAKLILINGKISDRSFNRLKRLPFLAKRLMGAFNHYYLQSAVYQERFVNLGIPLNKITVTGNLKLDGLSPPSIKNKPSDFTITLASTHEPEEQLWMDALRDLPVKVYLAPRHPERFEVVAKGLAKQKITFGRWSKKDNFSDCSVILVDQMGVLKDCYSQSHVAFVGGTFVPKIGGHNLLEPSFYGIPVLYGPYIWGQPDLDDLVCRHLAGRKIQAEQIREIILEFMTYPEKALEMGKRGQQIFFQSSGALNTVLLGIKEQL